MGKFWQEDRVLRSRVLLSRHSRTWAGMNGWLPIPSDSNPSMVISRRNRFGRKSYCHSALSESKEISPRHARHESIQKATGRLGTVTYPKQINRFILKSITYRFIVCCVSDLLWKRNGAELKNRTFGAGRSSYSLE